MNAILGSTVGQRRQSVASRTKEVRLVRDAGGAGDAGFGFTFRTNGGSESNLKAPAGRPFVITSIRPNSPAERYSSLNFRKIKQLL